MRLSEWENLVLGIDKSLVWIFMWLGEEDSRKHFVCYKGNSLTLILFIWKTLRPDERIFIYYF